LFKCCLHKEKKMLFITHTLYISLYMKAKTNILTCHKSIQIRFQLHTIKKNSLQVQLYESFVLQGSNLYNIVSKKEKVQSCVEMMAKNTRYCIEVPVGFFESI
jgi:hypothetical protein